MIDFILSVESGIERQETVRVFHAPPIGDGMCCLEISEEVGKGSTLVVNGLKPTTVSHGVLLNKAEARGIAERLMEYVNGD